jgi:predicted house-cleaning NTP pyrophosphatase (Maf/HAM1 superfamily)
MNLIGGLNMRINQVQEPTKLTRNLDYPSLLRWVATRAIVLFDTAERRSWLVDGASALLHLVRTSLRRDQEDEESPYEWVFDESKLKDTWIGSSSRQGALNTLKDSDNLNLRLYLIEKVERDGQMIERFSTLRERVLAILHSLEILVDTQTREATKGEMKTLQTVDRRKFITGYDILDIIDPLDSVSSRIFRFNTWGDGWMDLLPAINATTVFGQGFGDLLRPKCTASICKHWKSVPTRQDYMCVSVSTMKMLHEKRLQRLESPPKAGQLTRNLLWKSACQPFETCPCALGNSMVAHEHLDPRQFLVSSKQNWKAPLKTKASACVDLGSLQDTGAVVFANSGIFNRKISDKPEEVETATTVLSPMQNSASHSASTSVIVSDSTGITDTSHTSDRTTTIDALDPGSASTSAPDTTSPTGGANANVTPGQGKGKRKNKGKSRKRRVKDFFR